MNLTNSQLSLVTGSLSTGDFWTLHGIQDGYTFGSSESVAARGLVKLQLAERVSSDSQYWPGSDDEYVNLTIYKLTPLGLEMAS